jgi:hypothetical protein
LTNRPWGGMSSRFVSNYGVCFSGVCDRRDMRVAEGFLAALEGRNQTHGRFLATAWSGTPAQKPLSETVSTNRGFALAFISDRSC